MRPGIWEGLPWVWKCSLEEAMASWYPLIVGILAFTVLWFGKLRYLEYFFMLLVAVMSICFVTTAILVGPNLLDIAQGLFLPGLPDQSLFYVIALIGTTVVPYNLFLHASLVKDKWNSVDDLKQVRWDTAISLLLGGVISMAIVISAAAMEGN